MANKPRVLLPEGSGDIVGMGPEIEDALANRRRRTGPRPRVTGLSVEYGTAGSPAQVALDAVLPDGTKAEVVLRLMDGRVRVVPPVRITPPPSADEFDDLPGLGHLPDWAGVCSDWSHYVRESAHLVELPEGWAEALGPRRIGRRSHSDRFYAVWVERYLNACATSDQPMKTLRVEYPAETGDSLNRYIRQAEKLGLISNRPGHGKSGGEMTARCKRLLRERE
jgi:hypothetical protein